MHVCANTSGCFGHTRKTPHIHRQAESSRLRLSQAPWKSAKVGVNLSYHIYRCLHWLGKKVKGTSRKKGKEAAKKWPSETLQRAGRIYSSQDSATSYRAMASPAKSNRLSLAMERTGKWWATHQRSAPSAAVGWRNSAIEIPPLPFRTSPARLRRFSCRGRTEIDRDRSSLISNGLLAAVFPTKSGFSVKLMLDFLLRLQDFLPRDPKRCGCPSWGGQFLLAQGKLLLPVILLLEFGKKIRV